MTGQMIEPKEHFHGSDLEKIEAIYGVKKEDIVNFAGNVNPLGISPSLKEGIASHIDAISTYPDREYKSLRKCIADYAGSNPDRIVLGNGSTELISKFIHLVAPKEAIILGPTYSEYQREIELSGGHTSYYQLNEAFDFHMDVDDFIRHITPDVDLIVLCNPNNPTSTMIDSHEIERILDRCEDTDTYLMVDETYVEFVSKVTEVTAIPLCERHDKLIVLRGTSKFFAAPGLRLGYAVTSSDRLLTEISSDKNPWMIHSLADVAGQLMFTDKRYIEASRTLIDTERLLCFKALSDSKAYKPYKPEANFMLVRILDPALNSHVLFEKCIRENMMIRDCSTFKTLDDRYIRFCFMGRDDDEKLLSLLLN